VGLTALILNEKGAQIAACSLDKKTLVEGMNWHQGEIAKLGADAEKVVFLDYPPDDFPVHAIAKVAPFNITQAETQRQELANYYANTNLVLQEIVAENQATSLIHIWPHHFDMATLIALPGTKNGEQMTVGVGMSPGDTSYNEPYWYVTPWPYPDTASLPQLQGGGVWHTQGWVGAVLTASELTVGKVEGQQEQVRLFLRSAVKASKTLLQT
jgi:hypothetical protein